jgi:LemA protein
MQFLKTKIEQAEGIIDESLRERYDLLVRASDIVKSELNDGKDYFKEYINLKNKQVTNFLADRKLKEAFNILSKLNDDYPILQKNKELKDIFVSIKASNERISATTSYYNKNTNELNEYIRKFPSLIIAKINNFKIKPFFDGKDMTDDIYDDFKF